MKVRYSMEAFALAMILFTTGLEEALIAACAIMLGTIVGDGMSDKTNPKAAAVVGGAATFLLLIWTLTGTGLMEASVLSVGFLEALLVGILVAVHTWKGVESAGDGEIIRENLTAVLIMAVVGAVREFLAGGALYGYTLLSGSLFSGTYGQIYFGLIFGGLGIAAVNTILKKEVTVESLWVAVSVALVMIAEEAVGGSVSGILAAVVAAVIAVVLLVGVRGKLIFSGSGKHFSGLPVEMISFGFLTMMLSVIA